MYAIIYWENENDEMVKPLLNFDGTLHLFERLDGNDGADALAEKFEKENPGLDARVISIEGVNE